MIYDTIDITVSSYQSKGMRTTLTLDDDVYQAALHLSRVSGRRIGKVVSQLVRRALSKPASSRGGGDRFPTFDVPPNAPVIPASRVQEVLDEEGYI